MQFLLWDAQRRAGISDAEITAAMENKLKINMERQWPEPKDGEPRLHIKEPGNSPVITDGWISCSDRMPEIRQTVIGWNGYAVRQCVYTRNEYAKTQKGREPRFETLTGIWHGVTHWMPLPEPPQGG